MIFPEKIAISLQIQLSQYFFDPFLKHRQILLHDIPDPFDIDAQVLVNDNIPKALDVPPVHFRMLLFQRVGKSLRGLGKDLQVAHDRVLSFGISEEDVFALFRVHDHALDAFLDINQIEPVILHNGTASSSTLSRMYQ